MSCVGGVGLVQQRVADFLVQGRVEDVDLREARIGRSVVRRGRVGVVAAVVGRREGGADGEVDGRVVAGAAVAVDGRDQGAGLGVPERAAV